VKIGALYKNANDIFVADKMLQKTDNYDYVLCYNVVFNKTNKLFGIANAFLKTGKPFVLTLDELSSQTALDLKCYNCLYFNEVRLKNNSEYFRCSCSQHEFPPSNQYAQFANDCRLFRSVTNSYQKNKCDDDIIKNKLNGIFAGYKFENDGIAYGGRTVASKYGCLGGVLSKELFEELFFCFRDESVTVVEGFSKFAFSAPSLKNIAYSIPINEFDYSFYLHECKLIFNIAFLFETSKTIVVIYNEAVYIIEF